MNSSNAKARERTPWRWLTALFAVAVLVNYPWEMAQSFLYVGMGDVSLALWHCFVASLADGLLVLLISAAGYLAFRRLNWFEHPGLRGYALMLVAGLTFSLVVEFIAVRVLGGWTYTKLMPLLFGVGLAPVAQMLMLPPLIFRVVSMWRQRLQASKSQSN